MGVWKSVADSRVQPYGSRPQFLPLCTVFHSLIRCCVLFWSAQKSNRLNVNKFPSFLLFLYSWNLVEAHITKNTELTVVLQTIGSSTRCSSFRGPGLPPTFYHKDMASEVRTTSCFQATGIQEGAKITQEV